MADDRSLDEFVDPEEPADPDGAGDRATGGPGKPAGGSEPGAAVEPMAETYAWSAEGGTCAGCGAEVEARWRDEGALVCADCKAW